MKRIIAGVAFAVILMSIGIIWMDEKPGTQTIAIDPLHDGTFTFAGTKMTLKGGFSEIADLGIAAKTTTRYFGKDAVGDVNQDGRKDRAFLVTQELGGAGTFFYLIALLDTPSGKVGTNAVFLGDRITPLNTSIDSKGIVLVNYADRKVNESFTDPPSLKKYLYLKLDPKTLKFVEVVQGLKGKTDPSQMTLDMKKWNWVSTVYGVGKVIKPLKQNRFALTFQADSTFSATTDCNSVSGSYFSNGKTLSFTNLVSTLMACGPSQEREFTDMLQQTQSFDFTSNGQLILNLKLNKGSFIFN